MAGELKKSQSFLDQKVCVEKRGGYLSSTDLQLIYSVQEKKKKNPDQYVNYTWELKIKDQMNSS